MRNPVFLMLVALIAGSASHLAAQSREEVHFTAGNDNAAVEASVTGQEYKDYVLGASAGQTMGVSLITDGTAYFNILAPEGEAVPAIYVGSMDGNDASVELPEDGDYTIRVYLMGNDKDSGATVPFTLSMTIM
jgi:hypothetical protein